MENQKGKNNAKIGSEPSKHTFGNTPDKPDNIKETDKPGTGDPISNGAHQSHLKISDRKAKK